MLCSRCGRLPGPICSLCRTVERIRILAASPGCTTPTSWSTTLRVLRETSGILFDISEENSGWGIAVGAGGSLPTTGVVVTPELVASGPLGSAPKSRPAPPPEVRAELEEEKEAPKRERKEKKDKKERDRKRKKEAAAKPKEVESRAALEERPPAAEEVERVEEPANPANVGEHRVWGSAARHFRQREDEGAGGPSAGSGERRPREPSRSPLERPEEEDKKKHRGSKGTKHRERGRQWREGQWTSPRSQQQWRRK